jgi:ATP-dependent protease ClpP protease subunit
MNRQQVMAFIVKSEGSTMNLDVYESIGESYWGDSVTAKDVLTQLRAEKPNVVNMRVNSGGGDLLEAFAICNLLKASAAKINVSIDGIAASAATHLWPIGSSVTMAKNAMMMIHRGWSVSVGNAEDMRKQGELLDAADAIQCASYCEHSASRGMAMTEARCMEMMKAETWMSAEEAKMCGLVDTIGESVAIAASVDVTAFRNTPQELIGRLAASQAFTGPTAAPPQENRMDPTTMNAAIQAKEAELATINAELKTANASIQALTAQNGVLVTERDSANERAVKAEAKLLEAEVDALVPAKLDPAERDDFVALAQCNRPLFDKMVAQRSARVLGTRIVPEVATTETPATGEQEDDLVTLVQGDA